MLGPIGDGNQVCECTFHVIDIVALFMAIARQVWIHSEGYEWILDGREPKIRSQFTNLEGNYLLVTKSKAIKSCEPVENMFPSLCRLSSPSSTSVLAFIQLHITSPTSAVL